MCIDGSVVIWDVDHARLVRVLAGVAVPDPTLAWSPDGALLAVAGGGSAAVTLWDPGAGRRLADLLGHALAVRAVAWSPDGSRLASAGDDGVVLVWDRATGGIAARLPQSGGGARVGAAQPVRQVADRAATEDLIGRAALADVLAGQLPALVASEVRAGAEGSFAVLVTGAWGSGKSSLANLVVDALGREPESAAWVMPRPNRFLDAWRENRIGPAWWSLLTWLRSTVRDAQPNRRARTSFRLRELAHRFRLSGLAWPTAAVAVGVVAGVAGFVRWAQPDRRLDAADAVSWAVPALTALLALVAAGALAASRWLTWRTPAGARLFQRRDDNPMETVAAHADWLRRQVDAPVVLVVDDLDRCDAPFTVELLEAVETVVRRPPTHGRPAVPPVQPLVVLVCADERWLHAAFETIYAPFTAAVRRSGTTLGSLFLAKLFQLRLRVPDLDVATAVVFARRKLGLPLPDTGTGGPMGAGAGPAAGVGTVDGPASPIDTRLDEVRRTGDPELARARLREVSRQSASVEGQQVLRHELEDFPAVAGAAAPRRGAAHQRLHDPPADHRRVGRRRAAGRAGPLGDPGDALAGFGRRAGGAARTGRRLGGPRGGGGRSPGPAGPVRRGAGRHRGGAPRSAHGHRRAPLPGRGRAGRGRWGRAAAGPAGPRSAGARALHGRGTGPPGRRPAGRRHGAGLTRSTARRRHFSRVHRNRAGPPPGGRPIRPWGDDGDAVVGDDEPVSADTVRVIAPRSGSMNLRNKRAAQGAVAAAGAAVAAVAVAGPASAGTVPLTVARTSSGAIVSSLSQRDLSTVLTPGRVRLVHQVDYAHIDVPGCLACGLGGYDDRFDDPVIDPDPYDIVSGGVIDGGGLNPAELDLGGFAPVGP